MKLRRHISITKEGSRYKGTAMKSSTKISKRICQLMHIDMEEARFILSMVEAALLLTLIEDESLNFLGLARLKPVKSTDGKLMLSKSDLGALDKILMDTAFASSNYPHLEEFHLEIMRRIKEGNDTVQKDTNTQL